MFLIRPYRRCQTSLKPKVGVLGRVPQTRACKSFHISGVAAQQDLLRTARTPWEEASSEGGSYLANGPGTQVDGIYPEPSSQFRAQQPYIARLQST